MRYKPRQIVIACGDGTEVLKGLHWSRWKSAKATGSGTDYMNSCTPDCAAGHRTPYPATVALTMPVTCSGRPVFSRMVVTFTHARPHRRRTETDRWTCPR
jgi:hypothetical protein